MATGGELVDDGRNVLLNRTYKETPDYNAPTKCKVGVGTTTPNTSDTNCENIVPMDYGIVNDNGDNQLTGSSGGDNTTDNTSTYKIGGGRADNTSQNLIANSSSTSKIWTILDLSILGINLDETKRTGLWIYIKDSATFDKFATSGTCLEVKFGSDDSNYYNMTYEASDLSAGWNWLTSNLDNLEDLTETGTVSGDIDFFEIDITTNNATDTFSTDDICYDLLRQWELADTLGDINMGYPSFDAPHQEVTIQFYIHSLQANGFMLTECGSFTDDTTPTMIDHDVFSGVSKSLTDEMIITVVNDLT